MPLPPPPVPREELHLRQIELRGYRRNETLPAGAPLHDMWIRVCSTRISPCTTSGFGRIARERLSGAQGCTHLNELLIPLASTAFQTLSPVRNANPDRLDKNGRPLKIDSCYAYASTRELVRVNWPAFHK
jgi:hypothetical protein